MGTPRAASGVLLRDPVLRALLVITAAGAVWYLLPGDGGIAKLALFWPIQVLLDVGFAVMSARMSALPEVSGSTRRFWRLIAGGAVLFTVADAVQGAQTFATPVTGMLEGSALQSALVTLGSLVCLLAMVLHPTRTAGRERLRFMLDAGTVVVATGVFVWYLSPAVDVHQDPATLLLSLASAGASLAGAFGLVKLMLGRNMPFTPVAGWSAGLAGVLVGLSTGLTPALVQVTRPDVVMLARLVPCVLLAAVPRINEVGLRADPDILGRRRARAFSLIPYAAVAAAFALLVVALSEGRLGVRQWGVIAGVVLATAIVVSRQLIAFTDNARLLGELDSSLRALAEQEERFRALVQHSSDVTVIAGPDQVVAYASPAVERALGLPVDSVVGRTVEDLAVPEDRDGLRARMAGVLQQPGGSVALRLRVRHTDGSVRWLSAVATNLTDVPGIRGVVYNAHDITDVVAFQDRLRHEATHDALTGLANRALFNERLAGVAHLVAILVIDLDGFKAVNDTLGHHAGDALLRAVAVRLRECIRPVDTAARLGGDEFAVLLPGGGPAEVAVAVRCVRAAFAEPVPIDGELVAIRASIGTAHGTPDRAEELLREADAAMYAVKQAGARADRSGQFAG